jgi:hypothetical protein
MFSVDLSYTDDVKATWNVWLHEESSGSLVSCVISRRCQMRWLCDVGDKWTNDHRMDQADRTKLKHSDEALCHEAQMDRSWIKTGFRRVMPASA